MGSGSPIRVTVGDWNSLAIFTVIPMPPVALVNTICVSSKLVASSFSLKVKLTVLFSGVLRVDTGVMFSSHDGHLLMVGLL